MSQMAIVSTYDAPLDLEECLRLLAERADTVVLAGGMSVLPQLRSRQLRPDALLDLGRARALRIFEPSVDSLVVGAMVRYRDLWQSRHVAERWSALADAAEHIGDRQVQNRGTLGGNLAWGAPTSDLVAAVAALDGQLTIVSAGAERSVTCEEFFAVPREARLADGELIRCVTFPAPPPRSGSAYLKYGITHSGRPVVSIAATLTLDSTGRCDRVRMVLGGLLATPYFVDSSALGLVDTVASDGDLARAADVAAAEAPTHVDARGSAEYRRQLIRVYGRRTLSRALARARKGLDR